MACSGRVGEGFKARCPELTIDSFSSETSTVCVAACVYAITCILWSSGLGVLSVRALFTQTHTIVCSGPSTMFAQSSERCLCGARLGNNARLGLLWRRGLVLRGIRPVESIAALSMTPATSCPSKKFVFLTIVVSDRSEKVGVQVASIDQGATYSTTSHTSCVDLSRVRHRTDVLATCLNRQGTVEVESKLARGFRLGSACFSSTARSRCKKLSPQLSG